MKSVNTRATRIAGVACATLLLSGCPSLGELMTEKILGTIRIAIDLPAPIRNGALLAIQEANAPDNGVGGFRIEPVIVDPPSRSPTEGVDNLKFLLKDQTVKAMVGPADAAVARAQIPVAGRDSRFAIVSPSIADPCLTVPLAGCKDGELDSLYPVRATLTNEAVRNFFRVIPTTDIQGGASADYVVEQLDIHNAYTIDNGSNDGRRFATNFSRRFQIKGGVVMGQASFTFPDPGKLDIALIAALRKGARLIVFGGSDLEAGAVRARMGTSSDMALLASQSARSEGFLTAAGTSADGSYACVPRADLDNLDSAQDFLRTFKATYPRPADYGPDVAYAYDATGAIIAAIRSTLGVKTLPPTRDELLSRLRSVNEPATKGGFLAPPRYDGALGRFQWNDNGDTSLKLVSFYTVTAGRWNYVDQVPYRG